MFAGILVLLAAYPVYKLVVKDPTCFDMKKNGNETGVDCGGSCALMCAQDVKAPRIVWAKAFSLINGKYDVAAYVENLNNNAGIKNAHYTLRVLDANDDLLTEKSGMLDIVPGSRALIFETDVQTSSTPATVEVAFDPRDLAHWIKASAAPSPVVTKNQSLKNIDLAPRFDAVLVNTDPVNAVSGLVLGAIVYDMSRNPVAVSKTYVDSIPKMGEQNIFFTWPSRLTKYPRGSKCDAFGDIIATSATSSMITDPSAPCPNENFITEIIITPRAIFNE